MPQENVHEIWFDEQLDAALATMWSDVDTEERVLRRACADLLATAAATVGSELGRSRPPRSPR